jgi:hypothetical protein
MAELRDCERELCVYDLPPTCFAQQLIAKLDDIVERGRLRGVTTRETSAVGVDRHRSVER